MFEYIVYFGNEFVAVECVSHNTALELAVHQRILEGRDSVITGFMKSSPVKGKTKELYRLNTTVKPCNVEKVSVLRLQSGYLIGNKEQPYLHMDGYQYFDTQDMAQKIASLYNAIK